MADGYAAVAARLRAAASVLISSHVNPDGDAIGAILGTALALEAAGKCCLAVNPDPVPWTFLKLPRAEKVRRWQDLEAFGRPDLWLALDSADQRRLGVPDELAPLLADVPIVQFDHHVTNTAYGLINIIEPAAAACCEQMAYFLPAAGFALTPDAATALLCGITTDSGSFKFGSVTPATFQAAARLMEAGGSQKDVGTLLGERRFASTRLWGLVLTTLRQHEGGRIVEATATQEMFRAVGLNEEGTEGVVEAVRGIEGVELAVLFREDPSGDIKISLRTTEAIDATTIAVAHGGGGHPRAAGATLPGPLDAARATILAEAAALLNGRSHRQ
mgnify:CR=1 FL=1